LGEVGGVTSILQMFLAALVGPLSEFEFLVKYLNRLFLVGTNSKNIFTQSKKTNKRLYLKDKINKDLSHIIKNH
jgi:hypothetical protein